MCTWSCLVYGQMSLWGRPLIIYLLYLFIVVSVCIIGTINIGLIYYHNEINVLNYSFCASIINNNNIIVIIISFIYQCIVYDRYNNRIYK